MITAKELFDFSIRSNYNTINSKTAKELFEAIAEKIQKNDEAFFSCAYQKKDISYAYAICFKKVIVANTKQGVGDILFTGNEKEAREARETFKNNLIKEF